MIQFNDEQQLLIKNAVYWYNYSPEQVFSYSGGPGTGKSLVLNEIIKCIGLDLSEVAPMSFTGAASLVMRCKGLYNARTAHSWLYNIVEVNATDKNGNILMDNLLGRPLKTIKFIPVEKLPDNIKLIVVDEAYSMPLSMRKIIEKFGIKILACGDADQLPPVGDFPAFLSDPNTFKLTKCMRQYDKKDIVEIANTVKCGKDLPYGTYQNSSVIDFKDLTKEMLLWADIIISGTNKTRDRINEMMRKIKGYTSNLPQCGEKLVCRNNNWNEYAEVDKDYKLNLCNGLIGTVLNNPDVSSFNGNTFSLVFSPNLAPGVIFNTRANYHHMITNNYMARTTIKNNRYEQGNMFEYAYCITSHISQGSQFHKVIYLEERLHPNIQAPANLVGATRADQALIYVKNVK